MPPDFDADSRIRAFATVLENKCGIRWIEIGGARWRTTEWTVRGAPPHEAVDASDLYRFASPFARCTNFFVASDVL